MILRLMVAYSVKASLSIFVLFIDLVAAYDSIVREIAFGFPHNIDERDRFKY